MRFVIIIVPVAMFGAGAGLVSVGTAQAHGGNGGGAVETLQRHSVCAVGLAAAQASGGADACSDLLDGGERQ